MHRVPEVEITRSLADPQKRINAFIDCAEMLAWGHSTHGGRFVSRATMVFAQIETLRPHRVTWKFSFLNTAAAMAFNKRFDPHSRQTLSHAR